MKLIIRRRVPKESPKEAFSSILSSMCSLTMPRNKFPLFPCHYRIMAKINDTKVGSIASDLHKDSNTWSANNTYRTSPNLLKKALPLDLAWQSDPHDVHPACFV